MKASEIIKRARLVLQDEDGVRWVDSELLGWIDEGQHQIAKFPGVYSLTKNVSLKIGTSQELPSDCVTLESVSHNIDENGVALTPVRITTRALLDCYMPYWHQMPECQLVDNYVYDDKDPKHFSVFPPNDGTGKVEITYMAMPATVTKPTDSLVIDDTFATALLDWVLYRAFTKDSDFASGASSATTYYTAYTNEMQIELQSRSAVSPNLLLKPGIVKQNGGTE